MDVRDRFGLLGYHYLHLRAWRPGKIVSLKGQAPSHETTYTAGLCTTGEMGEGSEGGDDAEEVAGSAFSPDEYRWYAFFAIRSRWSRR